MGKSKKQNKVQTNKKNNENEWNSSSLNINNFFFCIYRYKDWKNRYYNQKEHDENESGKTTSMETTNNNENDDNDDDD